MRHFEILIPLAKVSIVASELIHELQKERGKTVGLITSGCNDINRGPVDEQRGLSDPQVANFFSVVEDTRIRTLSAEIDELVDELKQQTDGIAPHRSAVDGREIAVPAKVKFYTPIIKTLITIISKAVENSPSQELTHDLLAYVALVEAKEASGLVRAIGATLLNNIAKGKFSAPQFNLYYGKFAAEEAFLGEFRSFASKEQRALFDETVQGPDVKKVIEWRKVLHALPDTRDAQGISGKAWFDIVTKRINLIYAVERNIGERAIEAANRLAEEVASDQRNLIVIDTILLIIAAVIGILVGIRITRGLNAVTSDINRLSTGRFDFEVAMQDRTYEFGAVAKSLEGFRKNAEELVALEEKTQNLQKKAEHERSSMLTDLTASFEQSIGMTVQSLTNNCSQLDNVSESLGKKSEQGGNRSRAVAEATITTSQEVDTVAQTGSELSSTIQEISVRVAETTSTMRAVVHEVDDAATRIETLQMASQEIGSVVQLINDVAGQTNLLALNATIEAARAGDAGKGFAVVAAKVKSLPVQTENATSKILEQIRDIQEQTGVAVSSIRGIEESIRTADEVVAAIGAALEEQSATASQISSTMQIISGEAQTATEEISAVCQSAADSAGAAIKVMWSVNDLYQLRDNLRTGADDFVSELRRGTTT